MCKTFIFTGASRGSGRALDRELALAGVNLKNCPPGWQDAATKFDLTEKGLTLKHRKTIVE